MRPLDELRRRNILRMAGLYLGVAWADACALRKQPVDMFAWLERARGDPGWNLPSDGPIQRYKDDPRFTAFKKGGLLTTTDAKAPP